MMFRARVELGGKTATGIAVPDEVVQALNAGKRPAVRITLGGPHLPQHGGLDGRAVLRSAQRDQTASPRA